MQSKNLFMSDFSKPYRMDGPRDIPEGKLLFWPDNPRLKISNFKDLNFTPSQLVDPKNQTKIFELLKKTEHDVRDLVRSMRKDGFDRAKALIVMKVEGGRYQVLEGNRRLTAVRTLLNESDDKFLKEFAKIPCYIFVHTSKDIPLKVAISRLVAQHHIKGQKNHSKIQQAHMLYDAYMGFLYEVTKKEYFVYSPDIIKRSSDYFDLSVKEFECELAVFSIYKQLVDSDFKINHNLRERLTWIYHNPTHFKNCFGYCNKNYKLSIDGLERYYDMFIKQGCAIHRPDLFKKFSKILQHASKTKDNRYIEIIREDSTEFENVLDLIKDDTAENAFLEALKKISKKLRDLKVAGYKETPEEYAEMKGIQFLVEKRLFKFTNRFEELQAPEPSAPTISHKSESNNFFLPEEGEVKLVKSQLTANDKTDPALTSNYYIKDYILKDLCKYKTGDKIQLRMVTVEFPPCLDIIDDTNDETIETSEGEDYAVSAITIAPDINYRIRATSMEPDVTGDFELYAKIKDVPKAVLNTSDKLVKDNLWAEKIQTPTNLSENNFNFIQLNDKRKLLFLTKHTDYSQHNVTHTLLREKDLYIDCKYKIEIESSTFNPYFVFTILREDSSNIVKNIIVPNNSKSVKHIFTHNLKDNYIISVASRNKNETGKFSISLTDA